MTNEYELLDNFLRYCIELMGKEEWDRRFTNISNYHITLKTKPILLNEKPNKRGKTFISQQYLCQDLSMWYLYNIHNYIHNPSICDLGLIARTIPKVLRIAEALHLLKMQNGFKSKMDYLLREKCKEIENIFFEILVANLYLRNKAKNVDFLFAKSKKLADLLVSFNNNGELYIECKRKAKESEYARKERENWYTQYLPVQEYLKNNKISLVLKITFHNEINSYEDDFLYNIVLPYLKSTSIGILINTDQIRVEFYNPLFENINNGTIWKDYSPSFTQELFGFNDDKYGITSCFLSKRESPLSDYIYDVIFACAGLWFCDSPEAIEKKSLSFKRYICEGIGQIPYDKNGVLHICYESYEGSMVEKLNFDRTYLDLTDLKVQNKKIHFVYIHNLRLMWPPNKNWDVEETVYPFSSDYTNYEYSIEVPHIVAYP